MAKDFTGGKRTFSASNGSAKESFGERPRKNFMSGGQKDFKVKNRDRDWDSESEDEQTKKN